jgi:hypothetical protein
VLISWKRNRSGHLSFGRCGCGANVVAFLGTDHPAKVTLDNRDEILAAIQKLADRKTK